MSKTSEAWLTEGELTYRLPAQEEILRASFDLSDSDERSEVIIHPFTKGGTSALETSMDQSAHASAVTRIIEEISKGGLTKAVLSRTKQLDSSLSAEELFRSCCQEYHSAFVYHLKLKNGEEWVGASPETLLERNGDQYRTVSLAGTRTSQRDWTPKEIEEQAIVTNFIAEQLKNIGAQDLNIGMPLDDLAGALTHIRSDIHFTFSGNEEEVLKALHPTPAVCGAPKDAALDLILRLEPHDRRLYTGFIGIKNAERSRYFVNLRCARFEGHKVTLYAGGGIVSGSDPRSEWQETENKMNTLARFL